MFGHQFEFSLNMDKKWFEVPLSQVLKFRPYRKLLTCVYLLFSHENISPEETQSKLNEQETFEDFQKLWWSCAKYKLSEDTGITFENWQSCIANNPEVINFLLSKTRRRGSEHSIKEEPLGDQNISRLQTSKESTSWTTTTTNKN